MKLKVSKEAMRRIYGNGCPGDLELMVIGDRVSPYDDNEVLLIVRLDKQLQPKRDRMRWSEQGEFWETDDLPEDQYMAIVDELRRSMRLAGDHYDSIHYVLMEDPSSMQPRLLFKSIQS